MIAAQSPLAIASFGATQLPPTQTNEIERLRYLSEPLADDLLIAGPIALKFWASLDQEDTNWIVILKDVGPDVSIQSSGIRPDKTTDMVVSIKGVASEAHPLLSHQG